MSYCYLAFRTNVLLNLCCPGHLSYYSPNESEPLYYGVTIIILCMFVYKVDKQGLVGRLGHGLKPSSSK